MRADGGEEGGGRIGRVEGTFEGSAVGGEEGFLRGQKKMIEKRNARTQAREHKMTPAMNARVEGMLPKKLPADAPLPEYAL